MSLGWKFTDIIVFSGVICQYSTIKNFITVDDDICLATPEEIERYEKRS